MNKNFGVIKEGPLSIVINQNFEVELTNIDYTSERLIKCYKLIHDRDDICIGCKLENIFNRSEPYSVIEEECVVEGEEVVLRFYTSPLKNSRGDVAYVIEEIVDITDERLKLRESIKRERFISETIDSLNVSIAITDSTGKIILVNRGWREMADSNEFNMPDYGVGINYLDVTSNSIGTSSDGATDVAKNIFDVLRGERESFNYEYPCHSPTEQRFFILWASSFTIDSERFCVIAHYNITDRKRAEMEKEEVNKQLKKTLKVIDEFFNLINQCSKCGRIYITDERQEMIKRYLKENSAHIKLGDTTCPVCFNEIREERKRRRRAKE